MSGPVLGIRNKRTREIYCSGNPEIFAIPLVKDIKVLVKGEESKQKLYNIFFIDNFSPDRTDSDDGQIKSPRDMGGVDR